MFEASRYADVAPLEAAPRLRWVVQVGEPQRTCSLLPQIRAHAGAVVCAHGERWHVLDPDDGRVRFEIQARHPIPEVWDDVILAVEVRSPRRMSEVVARDARTGAVLWRRTFEGDVFFSPRRVLRCVETTVSAFAVPEPRRPPGDSPAWATVILPEAYVSAATSNHLLTQTNYVEDGYEGYVSSWAHLRAFDIETGAPWPAWNVDPQRQVQNLVADEHGMAFETGEFQRHSSTIDAVVKVFDGEGLRWSRPNANLIGLGHGVVVVNEPARPFDDGRLVVLDRGTGTVAADLGSTRKGAGRTLMAPPVIALARDIVYWGALSASRPDGTLLWRMSLDEVPGDAIYSLATLPNRVYGLTNGCVFCLQQG